MGRNRTDAWQATILLLFLGSALTVQAFLQFSWIDALSRTESRRLHRILDSAADQFRAELVSRLRVLCSEFTTEQDPFEEAGRKHFRAALREGDREGRSPAIVRALFVSARLQDGKTVLTRYDPDADRWSSAAWPADLEAIRSRYSPGRRDLTGDAGPVAAWSFWAESPALVRTQGERGIKAHDGMSRLIIVQLKQEYFTNELFPGLVQRHFGDREGMSFDVAVVLRRDQQEVIYHFPDGGALDWLSSPDERERLVRERGDRPSRPAVASQPQTSIRDGGAVVGRADQSERGAAVATVSLIAEGPPWMLLARDRPGQIEELVGVTRRRHLAAALGVMLCLAGGMAVVWVSARRAKHLARLQMEFVAGVSHDLRTPLAVVCSSADNLAEGVVPDAGPRARDYGAVIRENGRKLATMVEQILGYADLQSSPRNLDIRHVEVREVVQAALVDFADFLPTSTMEVVTELPADLPPAVADRGELLRILRNLLTNAATHAGTGGWVAIRAKRAGDRGGEWIEIRVEDRGPGIDPADLPHVFDAFYRGRNTNETGVRGSGLGLSLVRNRTAAMGGSVRAESRAGSGSAFIVRLPAAPNEAEACRQ